MLIGEMFTSFQIDLNLSNQNTKKLVEELKREKILIIRNNSIITTLTQSQYSVGNSTAPRSQTMTPDNKQGKPTSSQDHN